MGNLRKLEFFLLRYVPDAVREEFANIGVVVLESEAKGSSFADVRFTQDWRRVHCLDRDADIEMLQAMEREIRDHLRKAANREVFLKKMREGFSNLIQLSATKGCLAENPEAEMKLLARMYVDAPAYVGARGIRMVGSGRQKTWNTMRKSFEDAGVWELMSKGIAAAPYTRPGDPLKIDFGYRVGNEIRLFHAVSLKKNIEPAISLASRFPQIVAGMARGDGTAAELTAVVGEYDPLVPEVGYALSELAERGVRVAEERMMGEIAGRARMELLGGRA